MKTGGVLHVTCSAPPGFSTIDIGTRCEVASSAHCTEKETLAHSGGGIRSVAKRQSTAEIGLNCSEKSGGKNHRDSTFSVIQFYPASYNHVHLEVEAHDREQIFSPPASVCPIMSRWREGATQQHSERARA